MARPATESTSPALLAVRGFPAFLLVVLTAVLSGWVGPDFGWNPMSLRLVLTFVAVFLVLNYTGALVKWASGSSPTSSR